MEFKIGVVFLKNASCIAHGHDEIKLLKSSTNVYLFQYFLTLSKIST